MDTTRVLCLASVPMALVSLSFFIYGTVDISDYRSDLSTECDTFLWYNITHIAILLSSILVLATFILCGVCLSSFLFISNAIIIIGQLIDKYENEDDHCNAYCEGNCTQLVELSEKTNYCLIGQGIIILIAGTYIVLKFIRCLVCCG